MKSRVITNFFLNKNKDYFEKHVIVINKIFFIYSFNESIFIKYNLECVKLEMPILK